MDPSRRRKTRLAAALSAALLLAVALAYTSFSASSEAIGPGRLLRSAQHGRAYQLTGVVLAGSVHRERGVLRFRVRDRSGSVSVPISYAGALPEPFREGREVIIVVRRQGAGFSGRRDSLVTKCPSKFVAERPS